MTELLLAFALTCAAGVPPQQPLADFTIRIKSYMNMRRAIQQLPPMSIGVDRAATAREADALARAIIRARPDARPGDIFSPEISTAFRNAIGSGCAHRFEELCSALAADLDGTCLPGPALHRRWPEGAPLPTMPPDVLAALPVLPAGLEYRFMDRALVLRDVDANLVIDYLPDAIPQPPVLSPARLLHGAAPVTPMMLSGETVLKVSVDHAGRVAGIRSLRSTPSMTDFVSAAVRDWRFEPAQRRYDFETYTIRSSVMTQRMSTVLVVAMFWPPSLAAPTLRQAPADGASGMDETPRPVTWIAPVFPRRAFAPGVVLLELNVEGDGAVADARVVESAPPFDDVALDAVRQWRFRPGLVGGRPVPTLVYAVLGFTLPTEPDAGGPR